MLVNRYYYGYSNKKKHVTGKGFVDSLSSIFNTIKSATAPVFKTVGNYVSENKDLIAKPILGALGSLAATGLATGIPTIISHIANRNKKKHIGNPVSMQQEIVSENVEPKYKEILQNILNSKNNIIWQSFNEYHRQWDKIFLKQIAVCDYYIIRQFARNLPAICQLFAGYLPAIC